MRTTPFDHTRILVENVMRHPLDFEWSVQGLGMLRVYLRKPDLRLHIWDSELKVPGVSPLHTHPWHFDSLVIAGVVHNRRYIEMDENNAKSVGAEPFRCVEITCGENACMHEDPKQTWLVEQPGERYTANSVYHQERNEIHLSAPEDGTVTLIERIVPEGQSPDNARIFWRGKGSWVDAAPRKATDQEIIRITERSLQTWF